MSYVIVIIIKATIAMLTEVKTENKKGNQTVNQFRNH